MKKILPFIFIVCIVVLANSQALKSSVKNWISDFYEGQAFYHYDNGAYHYKNIRYYHLAISLSPFFPHHECFVKETTEVKGSNQQEDDTKIISVDIMTDLNKKEGLNRTFTRDCDKVTLYPHFLEATSIENHGGNNTVELFKYDNFDTPFLTSDDEFWYVNTNSSNQHISKNCYFFTSEKNTGEYACIFRLSDMNGLLQEVKVKSRKKYDLSFYSPGISLISKNPYQYEYHNNGNSEFCEVINISPKDYTNLRKHLTNTSFKLIFEDDGQEHVDSLFIPLENGFLFGKNEKSFEVEIF